MTPYTVDFNTVSTVGLESSMWSSCVGAVGELQASTP
jgi:hypothetical protein